MIKVVVPKVKDHTMTYPGGKGVFDLDFELDEGEVMGYLGPNGAAVMIFDRKRLPL